MDRASMAHSLEVRVPFLDHPLVEYVARIPSSLKLRNGEGKYILKQAVGDLLPQAVLNRPKMGFSIPLAAWFRNGFREPFETSVLARDSYVQEFLNLDVVQKCWKDHQQKACDCHRLLWATWVLEEWGRAFGGR